MNFKIVQIPSHQYAKGQIVTYNPVSGSNKRWRHGHVVSVGEHGDVVLIDHWNGSVRTIRNTLDNIRPSEARPCCRAHIKKGHCHE